MKIIKKKGKGKLYLDDFLDDLECLFFNLIFVCLIFNNYFLLLIVDLEIVCLVVLGVFNMFICIVMLLRLILCSLLCICLVFLMSFVVLIEIVRLWFIMKILF